MSSDRDFEIPSGSRLIAVLWVGLGHVLTVANGTYPPWRRIGVDPCRPDSTFLRGRVGPVLGNRTGRCVRSQRDMLRTELESVLVET